MYNLYIENLKGMSFVKIPFVAPKTTDLKLDKKSSEKYIVSLKIQRYLKKLNLEKKDLTDKLFCKYGATNTKLINCPAVSSITTFDGSFSSEFLDNLFVAHTPIKKETHAAYTIPSLPKKYAIKKASINVAKEPAVPGAFGDNPAPKNVAIIKANLFIVKNLSKKLNLVDYKSIKLNCKHIFLLYIIF